MNHITIYKLGFRSRSPFCRQKMKVVIILLATVTCLVTSDVTVEELCTNVCKSTSKPTASREPTTLPPDVKTETQPPVDKITCGKFGSSSRQPEALRSSSIFATESEIPWMVAVMNDTSWKQLYLLVWRQFDPSTSSSHRCRSFTRVRTERVWNLWKEKSGEAFFHRWYFSLQSESGKIENQRWCNW